MVLGAAHPCGQLHWFVSTIGLSQSQVADHLLLSRFVLRVVGNTSALLGTSWIRAAASLLFWLHFNCFVVQVYAIEVTPTHVPFSLQAFYRPIFPARTFRILAYWLVFVLMGWSLLPNALRPFQIYCAPPNLVISTWICRLNFAPWTTPENFS